MVAWFMLPLLLLGCSHEPDYWGTRTDEFRQSPGLAIDVLWVVDGAVPDERLEPLAAAFRAHFDADLQAGVVGMDGSGELVGDVVTAPAADTFELSRAPEGSLGFDSAIRALTPPLVETRNAGLMRDDVDRFVIFVSDREEGGSGSVQAFADALGWGFVLAIVGDDGCGEPGERYREAAELMRGGWTNLCADDLDRWLDFSALEPFLLTRFQLEWAPVPNSIEVTVAPDGGERWKLDTTLNQIVFDTAPARGAEITVRYTPL